MNIKRNTSSMQVARLISKGYLVANGRMVQLPENTKTQKHKNTRGGGVCYKCDRVWYGERGDWETTVTERPRDRAKSRTMLIASSLWSLWSQGLMVSKKNQWPRSPSRAQQHGTTTAHFRGKTRSRGGCTTLSGGPRERKKGSKTFFREKSALYPPRLQKFCYLCMMY